MNTIDEQLRKYAPQISAVMDELAPSFYTEREQTELERLFGRCDKISVDYAVMENPMRSIVIPCNPGWSDLGSWGSVRTHIDMDTDGKCRCRQ